MAIGSAYAKDSILMGRFFQSLQNLYKTCISVPKSCQGYQDLGVSESGLFMIDPDGTGTGNPPFQVFCNFETGKFYFQLYSLHTFLKMVQDT